MANLPRFPSPGRPVTQVQDSPLSDVNHWGIKIMLGAIIAHISPGQQLLYRLGTVFLAKALKSAGNPLSYSRLREGGEVSKGGAAARFIYGASTM